LLNQLIYFQTDLVGLVHHICLMVFRKKQPSQCRNFRSVIQRVVFRFGLNLMGSKSSRIKVKCWVALLLGGMSRRENHCLVYLLGTTNCISNQAQDKIEYMHHLGVTLNGIWVF